MKKILVTGASGFIGKSVCQTLSLSGRSVRGIVRSINSSSKNTDVELVLIDDISKKTNWKNILDDVDSVIHCASRAHIINELEADPLKAYQLVNVEGTRQLVNQSIEAGIRRFIFLSSIGVLGAHTNERLPFSEKDYPNPTDNYSKSKLEAEKLLFDISNKTSLEVVVVRSPLVYGLNAKGNLFRFQKLLNYGIPLPLGSIKNKISLIGLDNLVNLLIHCIDHPEAKGKTFLASDGEDLSTTDFLRQIASNMDRPAYLFPFPIFLLKFIASIFGKKKEIIRLTRSFKIDSSYTSKILDWTPPVTISEGIRRMVKGK